MARRNLEFGQLNGVRLIAEQVEGAGSIGVTCTIACGSVDDPEGRAGLAHLLEHLIFRGGARSMEEIYRQIDELGGYLGGATGGETTILGNHVREQDLEAALTLVADIALHPNSSDFDEERDVILAEIVEDRDNYEHEADQLALRQLYPGHPRARPILGTEAEVRATTREEILTYHAARYNADSIVIAAAGAVDLARLTAAAAPFAAARPGAMPVRSPLIASAPGIAFLERPSNGYLVRLSGPGRADQERAWPAALLTRLMSTLDSARLTRVLRSRGLVYDVSSYIMSSSAGGCVQVEFTVSGERLTEALTVCLDELERLAAGEINDEEVELARRWLLVRQELADAGAYHEQEAVMLADRLLSGLTPFHLGQEIEEIASVSADELRTLAQMFAPERLSLTAVGPDPDPWRRALDALARDLPALARERSV